MSNGNVAVLLSTYNGEKFIKEQIESIFEQDYEGKITIQIRDDGSKDNTIALLKRIQQNNVRKIIIEKGDNLGPQKSFLNLIKQSIDADYYFFADQDDIWDLDKISIATKTLFLEQDYPAVYCSNYRLTSNELEIYKEKAIEDKPRFTPLKVLFYNQIPGCTMAFNKKMMDKLKKMNLEDCMMHDSLVLCFASVAGKIIFDDSSRISHRIHGDNVVGVGHKKIVPVKWVKEKIQLLKNGESYDVSLMAKEFLRLLDDYSLNNQCLEDLKLLSVYKDSFFNTWKLLAHEDSHDKPFDRTTLSIRSKIIMRLF